MAGMYYGGTSTEQTPKPVTKPATDHRAGKLDCTCGFYAYFDDGNNPYHVARNDAMVKAIIGFRLKIKRIDAKFKLSQNRHRDDRRRVVAALDTEDYADASATAAWMRAYADLASESEA